jgi:hypothetical protein
MTQQAIPPAEPVAAKPSKGKHLCAAIDAAVDRRPGEEVRSVWLFDDLYRCNWWIQDAPSWLSATTGRINRSKFLRVRMEGDKLVIEDKSMKVAR